MGCPAPEKQGFVMIMADLAPSFFQKKLPHRDNPGGSLIGVCYLLLYQYGRICFHRSAVSGHGSGIKVHPECLGNSHTQADVSAEEMT